MGTRFFRLMVAVAAAAAGIAGSGCTKDELREEGFRLHYSDVIEIAQNITYNLEPTWSGGTPSNFQITEVTCEDAVYIGDEFSINPDSGVITIAGAANTTPADYKLSISCFVDGQTLSFPDIVTVYFINGIPEGISVEPSVIGADISELAADSDADLQTAQVTTEGDHIAITSYSIRNVKYEGTIVDNTSKPLFAISETGEISFVKGGPFELGTYTLDLKLSTRSYTEESNAGLFADAVTINVISAPTALVYTPSNGRVEADGQTGFSSVVPVLTGTADGITYSINVNTYPEGAAGSDRISIDKSTGVISFVEGEALTAGTVYTVDVIVESAYTEEPVTFRNAFTITVVDEIQAIENFSYAAVEKKEALGWTISPDDGLSGATYFSFTDPSASYTGFVRLNTLTGELSIEKYNKLPVGEYEISVTAHNGKAGDDTQAILELTIADNPYYFTYFSYGNNLGLTEARTGGVSQFRVTSADELSALSGNVLYSDIDQSIMGTSAITFSSAVRQRLGGTSVSDPRRGTISFNDNDFSTSITANQMGIVFVTAKTVDPEDGENTFSVTVPVCVDYSQPMTETSTEKTVSIQYSPFVLRVNPANGGRSATPVITGTTIDNLAIDYRRTFNYYNIDGTRSDGTEFESGTLNGSSGSNAFLEHLWDNYYGGNGSYGSKLPMAYYNGTTAKSASDLAISPCYVDNAAGANQYSVYVNPRIWYDDGWADGVFTGQMTFCTDGSNVSDGGETQRFFPVAIWFDKDYNE